MNTLPFTNTGEEFGERKDTNSGLNDNINGNGRAFLHNNSSFNEV